MALLNALHQYSFVLAVSSALRGFGNYRDESRQRRRCAGDRGYFGRLRQRPGIGGLLAYFWSHVHRLQSGRSAYISQWRRHRGGEYVRFLYCYGRRGEMRWSPNLTDSARSISNYCTWCTSSVPTRLRIYLPSPSPAFRRGVNALVAWAPRQSVGVAQL